MSISTTGISSRHEPAIDAPADPPSRRRRLPDLRRWISPVAIVLLWQLASGTGALPPDKLSSPLTVLRSGVDLARTGELGDALVISFRRAMIGFAIGAAIGIALGIIAGLSRWGEAGVRHPASRTLVPAL